MTAIEYREYHNQRVGDVNDDVYFAAIDHERALTEDGSHPLTVAEHILQAIDRRSDWPDVVTAWRNEVTGWMPEPLQTWWYEQFDGNPGLDSMSPERWQTEAFGMVAAWQDNRPVGMVALSIITGNDRTAHSTLVPSRVYFHEIRGLVVDPELRGTNHAIGKQLVRRAVSISRKYTEPNEPLATIAVTTNPRAAAIFRATGAFNSWDEVGRGRLDEAYLDIACWRQWPANKHDNLCDLCPLRDNHLWFWPLRPNNYPWLQAVIDGRS